MFPIVVNHPYCALAGLPIAPTHSWTILAEDATRFSEAGRPEQLFDGGVVDGSLILADRALDAHLLSNAGTEIASWLDSVDTRHGKPVRDLILNNGNFLLARFESSNPVAWVALETGGSGFISALVERLVEDATLVCGPCWHLDLSEIDGMPVEFTNAIDGIINKNKNSHTRRAIP